MKISTTCIGYTAGETYLISCAKIRNVSVPTLVRELIDVIARDQLVLATLDDGDAPRARVDRPRYARRFNERRVRLGRQQDCNAEPADREADSTPEHEAENAHD
jgi:hypothetical protein